MCAMLQYIHGFYLAVRRPYAPGNRTATRLCWKNVFYILEYESFLADTKYTQ